MNVPKLGSWVKPVTPPETEKVTEDPKKPFVPKPHLTNRPFVNDEGMRELQKQLHSREPKRNNTRRSNRTRKQEKK
jgi:hypothetical protein